MPRRRLVTQRARNGPIPSAAQRLAYRSRLVTHWLFCPPAAASTPDEQRANRALALRSAVLGNSPGSAAGRASAVVVRLCLLCDTLVLNSTSGVEDSSNRPGKPPHSTGTCVTFDASLGGPPSGPIMRHEQALLRTPQRHPEEHAKRIEEEEGRSFRENRPKKTDEEKPARSYRQIQRTIRTPLTVVSGGVIMY